MLWFRLAPDFLPTHDHIGVGFYLIAESQKVGQSRPYTNSISQKVGNSAQHQTSTNKTTTTTQHQTSTKHAKGD